MFWNKCDLNMCYIKGAPRKGQKEDSMKKVTVELTYSEVKTIYKALNALLRQDREQMKRDLLSEGAKKNLEHEIETCMILTDFDGESYKAFAEAHKQEER